MIALTDRGRETKLSTGTIANMNRMVKEDRGGTIDMDTHSLKRFVSKFRDYKRQLDNAMTASTIMKKEKKRVCTV